MHLVVSRAGRTRCKLARRPVGLLTHRPREAFLPQEQSATRAPIAGEQIGAGGARAYQGAMPSPRGPIFLVLPREPLSATVADIELSPPRALPAAPHPDPAAVAPLDRKSTRR